MSSYRTSVTRGHGGAQRPPAERRDRSLTRLVATLSTALTLFVFTYAALSTVFDPSSATLQDDTKFLIIASLVTPSILLIVGVADETIDVPFCIYWAWNFVFLGLAPAYQIAHQSFPWKGSISEDSAASALRLVLLGHCAFLVAYVYVKKRARRGSDTSDGLSNSAGITRLLARLSLIYCVIAVVFIALMGSSLYNARAQFREQVLAISQLPFGGTLYFLVTAGAITIPSALIAARRAGASVSVLALAAPLVCAAVVTNPLLGSRFLTGSFLVSISIAAFYGRPVLRFVPVASIILLTVLFPTLDVLRGDSSSSSAVRALDPEESVQTYDFDAFEMLAREVGLTDIDSVSLPSSLHLSLAPVMRWIPIAARPFIGDSGGAVVAEASGMEYTNVSMPLPGEGHLVGGSLGAAVLLAALGGWLGVSSAAKRESLGPQTVGGASFATKICAPATGALLFIVLRGSLYEVLAYLLLVLGLYVVVRREGRT